MRFAHPHQSLCRLLTLGAMAWFILWACAPMMSAPPSPPMPPLTKSESGHGGLGGVVLDQDPFPMPIGGYQYWLRKPIGLEKRNEMGTVAQLGWPGLGGGGYYRHALVKTEKAYLGAQVSVGFIWAEVALPAAIKMGEKVWLTTKPSIKAQYLGDIHMPIGLSWEVGERSRLDTELGIHVITTKPDESLPNVVESFQKLNNVGGYIGIGYARQFGGEQ